MGRIALLAVVGPILLLFVMVPVLALAVDLGGIVHGQLLQLKPQWEAQIGRKVHIGGVKLKLLPSVAAEVSELAIEAEPGHVGLAAQPLLSLTSARIGIAVWPLLWSLGREARVSYIRVHGLRINVVKLEDGRLSYEDVLDRLAEQERPKSQGLTPEQIAYLHRLSLSEVALTAMSLRFTDLSEGPPTPLVIEQVDLVARDVRLARPFTLTLDAALLAARRNLHVGLVVGPFPDDLKVEQPAALLRHAELRVLPVQIEPVLRFLPARGVGLQRALVDADLRLDMPAQAGTLLLKGSAGLGGLVLQKGAQGPSGRTAPRPALGAPVDVRVRVDLQADPLAGDVQAREVSLTVGDMGISGSADLRALWSAPAVHALSLRSQGLLLERLLAVLPPGELPRDAVLRGPLSLHGEASGSPADAQVGLGLDLQQATILLPALHKPEGTPLSAEFRGRMKAGSVDVERLGLVLGPLALFLHGTVHGAADVDLTVDSGRVALDRLLRLLPAVARSVPAGVSLGGDLQLKGSLRKQGDALSATTRVALSGARAELPDLALHGAATLVASVRESPAAASVDADLDLSGARLFVPGSVDKPAGVPMRIRLQAERAGKQVTIREAGLHLSAGTVEVTGHADLAGHRMDIRVPPCDLDLGKLGLLLPALHGKLPGGLGGHLRFALQVDGDPERTSDMHARLSGLDVGLGGGHVRGGAEVLGLSAPRRVSFDLSGEDVDLDQVVGSGADKKEEKPAPPGRTAAPTPAGRGDVPRSLRSLDLDGKLRIASGRLGGAPFHDLVIEVTMSGGKLVFKTLRMSAFSGEVAATGTTVDVSQSPPRFAVRAQLTRIDIGELMAVRNPSMGQKLQGRGSADLSVDGTHLSWADMAPHLSGQIGLSLKDGRLRTGSVIPVIAGLVGKLARLAPKPPKKEEIELNDLGVRFQVKDGKMHITEPLRFTSQEGTASLTGNIGLDQRLDLRGDIQLAPQVIAAASGGKIVPSGPIPLGLHFSGTLAAPVIEPMDIGRTLAALARYLLVGRARELLGGQLGGAAGQAAADPQAALQKAQQEAQQRLQEEARKREEEAKKRLEEEARKRLGGGLKDLFGK